MVMGMLEAGGLEIVSDGIRVADDSNPRGYYEDERVKTLDKSADTSWLETARGKAIKIISFLLKELPDTNHYRVIFMHRDMDEVLTSQRKMLHARGEPSEATADERMAAGYRSHLNAVNDLLSSRTCFDVLALSYEDVIGRSSEQAERINRFLGGGLDVSRMSAAVDPALYRNRR
jgi:sulfotransferase family protein